MNYFGPGQIGKCLILVGISIVVIGLIIMLLARFGIFKLPGDLTFASKNRQIFIPITTCFVISIVLTLILWIIRFLNR